VFFIFARKAAGASRARHSLRPPMRGLDADGKTSRNSCGEIAKLWLFEIESVAHPPPSS
jgi:hypothetical protein